MPTCRITRLSTRLAIMALLLVIRPTARTRGRCYFGFQVDGGSNINIYNNLYYLSVGLSYGNVANHDYNENVNLQNQLSSLGSITEPDGATNSVNPFVDYVNYNFSLVSDTPPGMNLGPPYNVDMFGNTRTTWTRGAIEYVNGTPPSGTPSIQVTPGSLALGTILSGTGTSGSFTVQNIGRGNIQRDGERGVALQHRVRWKLQFEFQPEPDGDRIFQSEQRGQLQSKRDVDGRWWSDCRGVRQCDQRAGESGDPGDAGELGIGDDFERDWRSGSFTVKNIGGGTLSGTASVVSPFSIVSGGSYNLSSNQSQTVTVSFNPSSAAVTAKMWGQTDGC